MEEPCIDCPKMNIDDYGYFCDISCGKRAAWFNYKAGQEEGEVTAYKKAHQAGIKEVVEWIESHPLIEPDKNSLTRFEPFYQIEQSKLKELGI